MRTTQRLLQGDARRLAGIGDSSVDLVVTSPPYPMVEMWDAAFSAMAPAAGKALARGRGMEAFEAMHASLDEAWAACARVLRPGGFLCVNVGDATRSLGGNFALYPNHARILQACMRLGLTPLPTILWRKTTNAPTKFMGSGMLPAGAYVTLEHEHVLILRKGGRRTFTSGQPARQESAIFWEERNRWFSDTWDLQGERQDLGDPLVPRRSAAFPLELPFRLVAMLSVRGDTVLDPFVGTGTTVAAAMALGRNGIGVEADSEVHRLAVARLPLLVLTCNARQLRRLEEHAAFVAARTAAGKALAHANEAHGVPVMTRQERRLRIDRIESLEVAGPGTFHATHGLLQMAPAAKAVQARRKAAVVA